MLLATLSASLLGNLLQVKAQLDQVKTMLQQVKIFNEPKFNGVYARNNLPKIKDGAYVTNFDEYKSIGTHWIALYVNGNNTIYFDSFGIEHFLKEIKKFIGNKNIATNIYRIQAYDSTLC